MNTSIPVKLIENSGGLGDCPGYKTAGVAGDIREIGDTERLDVALFTADTPCSAAGVFTLNDVCAAPVKVCKTILEKSADNIAGCISLAVFPIAVMPMPRLVNKA